PALTHAEILREALQLGIPALVEKPLSFNLKEAETLAALSRASGVPFLVNHVQLFHPAYQALKTMIDESIRVIRSSGGNQGPDREDCSPLWDYGPHDVALCLDLAGASPEKIQVKDAAPGNYSIEMGFSSGTRSEISGGNRFEKKVRKLEVELESGAVWMLD